MEHKNYGTSNIQDPTIWETLSTILRSIFVQHIGLDDRLVFLSRSTTL